MEMDQWVNVSLPVSHWQWPIDPWWWNNCAVACNFVVLSWH